jgi:hypothetical protein
MKSKQTAVEWVIKELKNKDYLGTFCTADAWEEEEKKMRLIIKQAKEMEKEQIEDAYFIGGHDNQNNRYRGMHEYYNEQYGGKDGE